MSQSKAKGRHPLLRALVFAALLASTTASCADRDASAPTISLKHTELQTNSYSEEEELWSARVNVIYGKEAAERGDLGLAALHFERARFLRPFDINIRQGVDLLRQQVQRERMMTYHHASLTQGEPDGLWWWRVFQVLPTRIWAGAALVSLWVAFIFWLALRRMKTGVPRDSVVVSAALSLIASLTFLACWIGAVRTSLHLEPGVVVQSSPQFFSAPDALAPEETCSDLYEGGVVLIRWRDDDWMEIELAGQQRVWVAAHTVVPIAVTQAISDIR